MKLFLDANVLFTAAHNPQGKAALVIELAGEGHWDVVTSSFAIEEARRNLKNKFPGALAAFESLLTASTLCPPLSTRPVPSNYLEKDVPIFLSARRAECTHLLTGDKKHFGKHMNVPHKTSGVIIQTVAGFLTNTSLPPN